MSQYVTKDINISTQRNSVISTALFGINCVQQFGTGSRNTVLICILFIHIYSFIFNYNETCSLAVVANANSVYFLCIPK